MPIVMRFTWVMADIVVLFSLVVFMACFLIIRLQSYGGFTFKIGIV